MPGNLKGAALENFIRDSVVTYHHQTCTCFPSPAAAEERRLSFRGLYDASLGLSLDHHVVGNDADADKQDLELE